MRHKDKLLIGLLTAVGRPFIHEVKGAMRCLCASDLVFFAAPCDRKVPLRKASLQYCNLTAPEARAQRYLLLPHFLSFSFLARLLVKPPARLVNLEQPKYNLYGRSSGETQRVLSGRQPSGASSKVLDVLAKPEACTPA